MQAHGVVNARRCSSFTVSSVQGAFLARLSKEKIKNPIDMHHRLGADGTRYGGKVLDYRCVPASNADAITIAVVDALGQLWPSPLQWWMLWSICGQQRCIVREHSRRQASNITFSGEPFADSASYVSQSC